MYPPPPAPDEHLIGEVEKPSPRSWGFRRRKVDRSNLHRQAALEREIYGRVMSPSLRDLPPPNPVISVRR